MDQDRDPRRQETRAAEVKERRRQLRGLLLLALAALAFTLYRAHPTLIFHPGWWRP